MRNYLIMDKFRGKLTLFILSLIILFPQIISTVASEQHKQYISDRAREMYSLVRTSSLSSWDKVRSLVNQVQKQYFPPDLDFRPRDEGHSTSGGGSNGDGAKERMWEAAGKSFSASKAAVEESAKSAKSTKERMQEAAGKSFGASKVAVEESAKSAADVVGKAVHKTTEKMKDCVGDASCHTEL